MKALAVAATALAAVVLVAEAGLRIAGYSAPRWHQIDPQLGWSGRPNKSGLYAWEGGYSHVRMNKAGFRDRDRFVDKLDGVYRIAVLGDEVSEALPVELAQTWWWRLPALLDSCKRELRVEVLNFSVGGYSTAQELVTLETKAMRYQPDLVLLQFSNANDVADNSLALSRDKLRPFYRVDAHGVPHVSESFAWSPAFERRMQTRYRLGEEIADHSRTFQLARQLADVAFIGEAHADRDIAILGEPHDARWEEAWRFTEALLARMKEFSERNGARFMLASAPHPLQPADVIAYPDQRLAQFARASHVPFVAWAGVLRPELYLHGGEWSAQAHRVAAEALAPRICPLL